jgi:hypothetical protein
MHEVVLDSVVDILPGQTLTITIRLMDLRHFRGIAFQRQPGVLYHLFDACQLYVGTNCQWRGRRNASTLFDAPRKLSDLLMVPHGFTPLPFGIEDAKAPLDVASEGCPISLAVENNDSSPLPFSIKLVGDKLTKE